MVNIALVQIEAIVDASTENFSFSLIEFMLEEKRKLCASLGLFYAKMVIPYKSAHSRKMKMAVLVEEGVQ